MSTITMEAALRYVEEKYTSFSLKTEQKNIVEHILEGKSVFCVLPTGFGKSACFYLPPIIKNFLEPAKKHVAVVVSPLRSLILNQVAALRSKCFRCANLTEMSEDVKTDVVNANLDVLFSSPEALMTDFGRELLTSTIYQERACLLAFDEAHCIVEWGDDFRPIYANVSTIRSWLSEAPVLLMSATVTKSIMNKVLTTLMMAHLDVQTVAVLPDRPNVYLNIKKSRSYEKELLWYVEELRRDGRVTKKAIIYCRSMTDAAGIYAFLMGHLGDAAWLTQKRDPSKRLVDVYHRSCAVSDQERVTVEFSKLTSSIRCVVATIAFGLGVDIADVRYIIHWGCSKSLLQYWQETGRCCRDGAYGTCHLHITPRSLDPRRVDEAMLEASKSSGCLRLAVLQHLLIPGMDTVKIETLKSRETCKRKCVTCRCSLCVCCSRCRGTCECSDVLF